MSTLTDLQAMILKSTRIQPGWLNCSGAYLGEVLALGYRGLIESRLQKGRLQVKAREGCQMCGQSKGNYIHGVG